MFANFLYFIVALLVLSLNRSADQLPLPLAEALLIFAALAALFALYIRSRYRGLVRRASSHSRAVLDQRLTALTTRHSMLAMVLFAVDVWGLDLPAYIKPLALFTALPTLSDLIFLMVFLGYLCIVWTFAYTAHQAIFHSDISRGSYVYSNLAFSLPVLLPYALLSGLLDLLQLLPFEQFRQVLDTAMGQIGYFVIFLLIVAIFAPLMVQRFWRCRPMEDGPARQRIEHLCRQAGVTYADIVYWPIFGGRMITAGVMGLVGRFRYILVTQALLQLLHPEEVDQVIAHEIGHVKRRHLPLYLLFFIGFMLISYAFSIAGYYLVFLTAPVLQLILRFDLNQVDVYSVVSSVLLVAGVIIYFRYIFGYFIRNFERQADGYVFELFPSAQPLISTFGKIASSSGQAADKPNWHHFSIQQRMDHLQMCERQPAAIKRHDRKVRNSILAYLAGVVVVGLAVFQMNQFVYSANNRELTLSAIESFLAKKETKSPQDALIYLMLGNLYYENRQVDRAAAAYDQALALNPDHPDILNNLAWLLATSDTPGLHNPETALAMAQKAVRLKPAPHIWDTLAECFYVNGRFREAVAAEAKALAMNPGDRSIYEAQMAKFKKALAEENPPES